MEKQKEKKELKQYLDFKRIEELPRRDLIELKQSQGVPLYRIKNKMVYYRLMGCFTDDMPKYNNAVYAAVFVASLYAEKILWKIRQDGYSRKEEAEEAGKTTVSMEEVMLESYKKASQSGKKEMEDLVQTNSLRWDINGRMAGKLLKIIRKEGLPENFDYGKLLNDLLYWNHNKKIHFRWAEKIFLEKQKQEEKEND